jgi:hypothetical protein
MQALRRVLFAGACMLAFLVVSVVPSSAKAGTAQLVDPDPGPPHLTFTAAGGETNHFYLLPAPGGYRLIDLGATITAGTGCSSMSSSEAFCAVVFADELPTIDILLGDQGDFASVAGQGSNEITVDGEGGADELELGAGCEFVFDGPCDVFLLGGTGDDMLRVQGPLRMDGGAGGDSMAGGVVDYSARVNPVTVDGDGVADDGEAGEGDNVADTVFRAIGGRPVTPSPASVGKDATATTRSPRVNTVIPSKGRRATMFALAAQPPTFAKAAPVKINSWAAGAATTSSAGAEPTRSAAVQVATASSATPGTIFSSATRGATSSLAGPVMTRSELATTREIA